MAPLFLLQGLFGATPGEAYGWLLRPAARAACYGATTCLALGLPLSGWVPAALFSAGFLIYAYDRLADTGSTHDQLNNSRRAAFMQRHAGAIRGAMAAAAAVLGVAAASLPAGFAAGLAPTLALSLLYALPLPLLGGASMRTAPGCKTLVTAGLWAVACAWLPVAAAGSGAAVAAGLTSPRLAAMLLHVATCVLGSVLKDVGDMAGDAATGTRSLPVLLGKRRTLALLVAAAGLDAVVCMWVLHQPALLIPNAFLAAAALGYDAGRHGQLPAVDFWWQLGAVSLARCLP